MSIFEPKKKKKNEDPKLGNLLNSTIDNYLTLLDLNIISYSLA